MVDGDARPIFQLLASRGLSPIALAKVRRAANDWMAETIPTSVVVCGLPEAGRLHVQQRDGEAATLHDVYATGSLLCALPAQPDEELVAQLPLLVSAPADPSNHSALGSRVCRVCCDSACPMA